MLFPEGAVTEGYGSTWKRTYPSSDSVLVYFNNQVRHHGFGLNKARVIGTAAQIESGEFNVNCSRKRDPLLTLDDVLG
jgi:hypothetical protein